MRIPEDTDRLIDSIREGVALDIYGLFEGAEKKRLVVETMLATIVTGLVLEYLKGLLRPKEVGEQRSKSIGAFIGGMREDKLPNQEALKAKLATGLAELTTASPEERRGAQTSFALDLVSAGVLSETAKTLSQVISDSVAKLQQASSPAMPHAAFTFAPFGDLAVIGAAHDLLLQRLCYCYHTSDPQIAREAYGLSQVAAFLEVSRPVFAGRTRWWRNTQDGRTTYICVDPASPGFRVTPPTERNVYIEDIPVEMGLSILPTIARTTLSERAKHRASDQAHVQHIVQGVTCASTRHAARDVPSFVEKMERCSAQMRLGQHKTQEAVQEAISHIYQAGLFEVEVDCAHFSASIALFELQTMMNLWIEQRAYVNPHSFLRGFIETGGASEQVLASVGEYHFTTGRETVSAALNKGCFWTFQEQIYLAVHHFWIAHMIATLCKAHLPYSRMVAEESLVCAHSGLACGLALFFDRSVMDIGKDLAASIARGEERPVEKFLHERCSVFFPVIPKPLAQMIVAFARILARPEGGGRESDLDPIYAADRAAGDTHPTSALFLSFTRDYLLLNAAKHLGLELAAQKYAAGIMGRLIIDRALT